MAPDIRDQFDAQIEEVNRLLDEYLRALLLKTETDATVEVAVTLLRDGWTGTMQGLIDAARHLSGGQP
jgi:predicted metal-binding protein